MICANVGRCLEILLKENGKFPPCKKRKDCIEFFDERTIVKCEENGIEYYIHNHMPSEIKMGRIHVEEHMIVQPDQKCDYMVVMKMKDKAEVVLVELKNKNNYRHAIRQLEQTLENLSDELASYHSVHGRLVWRTKKAPKMNADPILLKLSRSFKKRNGDFKMEGSPFKESSNDFLGCGS